MMNLANGLPSPDVHSHKRTHQDDSWNAIEHIPNHPTLDQFIGSRPLKPCQKLILDIIKDAFDCIRGTATMSEAGSLLLYRRGKAALDAIAWIENDSEEISSFRWCCYSVGWEHPERVRKYMLRFVNHDIVHLAQIFKFSVWKSKGSQVTKKSYRCSMEIEGERIDMGSYPTQRAAERAVWQEYGTRIQGSALDTIR